MIKDLIEAINFSPLLIGVSDVTPEPRLSYTNMGTHFSPLLIGVSDVTAAAGHSYDSGHHISVPY